MTKDRTSAERVRRYRDNLRRRRFVVGHMAVSEPVIELLVTLGLCSWEETEHKEKLTSSVQVLLEKVGSGELVLANKKSVTPLHTANPNRGTLEP